MLLYKVSRVFKDYKVSRVFKDCKVSRVFKVTKVLLAQLKGKQNK